jgi:hypothetical protein
MDRSLGADRLNDAHRSVGIARRDECYDVAAANADILLLLIGCVIEVAAALIILGPVLIPIMDSLGVDLIHFGVVMVVNLAIGTIHPPVGNCLYIVSAISGESIARCSIAVIPVVGVMGSGAPVDHIRARTCIFCAAIFRISSARLVIVRRPQKARFQNLNLRFKPCGVTNSPRVRDSGISICACPFA